MHALFTTRRYDITADWRVGPPTDPGMSAFSFAHDTPFALSLTSYPQAFNSVNGRTARSKVVYVCGIC